MFQSKGTGAHGGNQVCIRIDDDHPQPAGQATHKPGAKDFARAHRKQIAKYSPWQHRREHHRVEILHRVLCALWNGRATVVGPESSPERINVRLGGGVTMTLPLTPLNNASSWGSLLRSYELWALDDNDMHRAFCAQLMQEVPGGLRGRPEMPHELFLVVTDLAQEQITLLDDMMKKQAANQRSRATQMRSFWADTLPSALAQEFEHVDSPTAPNLRELQEAVDAGAAG